MIPVTLTSKGVEVIADTVENTLNRLYLQRIATEVHHKLTKKQAIYDRDIAKVRDKSHFS
jgi:hypothetical protein